MFNDQHQTVVFVKQRSMQMHKHYILMSKKTPKGHLIEVCKTVITVSYNKDLRLS